MVGDGRPGLSDRVGRRARVPGQSRRRSDTILGRDAGPQRDCRREPGAAAPSASTPPGRELDGDELTVARSAAYAAGLEELARSRVAWGSHGELFGRLESGLQDRTHHLATDDEAETADRRQERDKHEAIQLGIVNAQRAAVIDLRDRGEINDQTLRSIVHELDLEELRMEG